MIKVQYTYCPAFGNAVPASIVNNRQCPLTSPCGAAVNSRCRKGWPPLSVHREKTKLNSLKKAVPLLLLAPVSLEKNSAKGPKLYYMSANGPGLEVFLIILTTQFRDGWTTVGLKHSGILKHPQF